MSDGFEFEYSDMKCVKCGDEDLAWENMHCGIYYNLFSCKKCYSNFRVTTAMAPGIEDGHIVTMLSDVCMKCGGKPIKYSNTLKVLDLEYDYFKCTKCGSILFFDPEGNGFVKN